MKLLKPADSTRYDMPIRFTLATGLREGELLSLVWSDVDLDGRMVNVRGTKTANSRRSVELSEMMVDTERSLPVQNSEPMDLSRCRTSQRRFVGRWASYQGQTRHIGERRFITGSKRLWGSGICLDLRRSPTLLRARWPATCWSRSTNAISSEAASSARARWTPSTLRRLIQDVG